MTGFHFNGTVVSVLPESRFPFHRIPGSLGPEYSRCGSSVDSETIDLNDIIHDHSCLEFSTRAAYCLCKRVMAL